jgi:transposase
LSDKNIMDKDAYIKQLEDKIVELEKRIETLEKYIEKLERLLGTNSKNSSKPPSSDPPGMPSALPRKLRRKKRGAKKGHQPHLRELMPEEFIQKHIPLKPQVCTCGSTNIEETDQEPMRHQVVDIPPIKPQVTEYVQYFFRCKDCGELIYKPLPDDVKRKYFGPGVLAIVAVLTGMLNISKRKALAMINQVFSIPMSLGGLSNCEAQLTCALEQPYNEAAQYVRVQQTAYADETGWPRGNRQKGWLWAMCCSTAAFFMVHAQRGQDAAQKLLGTFAGILHCDRWSGYNRFGGLRQLCWAHLKRDFKSLSEAKGNMSRIGSDLFTLAKQILHMRKRVRDGTLLWQTFQHRMEPLIERVEALLEEGADSGEPLAGQCRRIFNLRQYLWTFVYDARVEPTNNFAERIVRQGVLWRKGSFGTQSERGARYVERILTVCATCRLQERSVIEYLRSICHCYLNGVVVLSLINPVDDQNNSA